jgi:hypothetical protein
VPGANLAGDLLGELLAAAGAEIGWPAIVLGGGDGQQYLVPQPAGEGVDLHFPVAVMHLHADDDGEQVPVRLPEVALCGGAPGQ